MKKEFLLKLTKDKRRWLKWLFEAKKRYGLQILDYIVTSNHIHLLVFDGGGQDVIPKSIQLIAGRTGQEYNQRKKRKGAYWEDRYHATAIESGEHLIQCLLYIEMNMIRAGVIKHPKKWDFCGYQEIQNPRQRYSLISYKSLMDLFRIKDIEEFKESHKNWIDERLEDYGLRESKWTESIAVGSKEFIEETKERLGMKVLGRDIGEDKDGYELREPQESYSAHFDPQKGLLRAQNAYFWDVSYWKLTC